MICSGVQVFLTMPPPLAQVVQYIELSELRLPLSDLVRVPLSGAGVSIGRTFEVAFSLAI